MSPQPHHLSGGNHLLTRLAGVVSLVAFGAWSQDIEEITPQGTMTWASPIGSTSTVEWAAHPGGPWFRDWDLMSDLVSETGYHTVPIPSYFRVSYEFAPSIERGLVAHWRLDGDALDATGNGHDGIIHGSPVPVLGMENTALQFNGDAYIQIPDHLDLNPPELTVSAWIKADAIDAEDGFFGKALSHAPTQYTLYVRPASEVRFSIKINNDYSGWIYTDEDPVADVWRHVTATADGQASRLYIDGVLRTEGVLPQGDINSPVDLLIGAAGWSNTGPGAKFLFNGIIDDVRFYGRALSPEEVAMLFGATPTPDLQRGLVAYYPLNGDALDVTGNGHHGTAVGVAYNSDGVSGGAYTFDGATSHILVPTHQDVLTSVFTVVAWVRTTSSGEFRGAWGKTQAFTPNVCQLLLTDGGNISFSFRVDGDQSGSISTPFGGHADNWTMVTVLYTGSNTAMYVNDQLIDDKPFANGPFQNSQDFLIGAGGFDTDGQTPKHLWLGDIDEVRVYERPLSPAEVAAMYEMYAPTGGR